MPQGLTASEEALLVVLGKYPKGAPIPKILQDLPGWTDERILVNMNSLSYKRYVDFLSVSKNKDLIFKIRSQEDMEKTANMGEYEIMIYQLIKDSKNNGIWIKDLKSCSGLHTKLVNSTIKNLEKRNVIKFVKPVNNPHKKMYLLTEYEPSTTLTGGIWYTDNEFDTSFIDQLSLQIFKYISHKTIIDYEGTIYSFSSGNWPSSRMILDFITKNNITSAPLNISDVEILLERLCLEGKIKKYKKYKSELLIKDDDDSEQIWVYTALARNYSEAGALDPFIGINCKEAADQASENSTTQPVDCTNLSKWLCG